MTHIQKNKEKQHNCDEPIIEEIGHYILQPLKMVMWHDLED